MSAEAPCEQRVSQAGRGPGSRTCPQKACAPPPVPRGAAGRGRKEGQQGWELALKRGRGGWNAGPQPPPRPPGETRRETPGQLLAQHPLGPGAVSVAWAELRAGQMGLGRAPPSGLRTMADARETAHFLTLSLLQNLFFGYSSHSISYWFQVCGTVFHCLRNFTR